MTKDHPTTPKRGNLKYAISLLLCCVLTWSFHISLNKCESIAVTSPPETDTDTSIHVFSQSDLTVSDSMEAAFDRVEEKYINDSAIQAANVKVPIIFFITPTHFVPVQMVNMIRLSQTLMHDQGIYWIVVEDGKMCTRRIREILDRSGLLYAHLAALTPQNVRGAKDAPRGVAQRNRALELIEELDVDGTIYFGDDDNAYDLRLFRELRKTIRVSIFGVAFRGGGLYERCVVDEKSGDVKYIATNWNGGRKYPMDMAGFAFTVQALRERHPRFQAHWPPGFLETRFLEQLVSSIDQLEPLMDDCHRIFVWHVKTTGESIARVHTDKDFEQIKALV